MISRSFFRQSAAFLGLSLCILTDSSPGMACTCPVPSTSAPAMPQHAPGGQEERRRGRDTARRTQHAQHPRRRPEAISTRPACTGWEKERRGREARREEQGKTARRRAVKVIYTEPMPTSTCPAPENSQPLPVLLPAQLLRPLSCNSAFGEFAEPQPPEAPIADGEHLPARLLSIQAPGEPLHFQRPGQFYKLTQYLPSLTYPSFFTRQ